MELVPARPRRRSRDKKRSLQVRDPSRGKSQALVTFDNNGREILPTDAGQPDYSHFHETPEGARVWGYEVGIMRYEGDLSSGSLSSHTTVFRSHGLDEEGQVHTEQLSSSSVVNVRGGIKETKQEHSSSKGVNRQVWERQLAGRGRKLAKECDMVTGEVRQLSMLSGMNDENAKDFDQQWHLEAGQHLPEHMSHKWQGNASHGLPSSIAGQRPGWLKQLTDGQDCPASPGAEAKQIMPTRSDSYDFTKQVEALKGELERKGFGLEISEQVSAGVTGWAASCPQWKWDSDVERPGADISKPLSPEKSIAFPKKRMPSSALPADDALPEPIPTSPSAGKLLRA